MTQITRISDAIEWSKEVYKNFGFETGDLQQSQIHIWYRGHSKESYQLIPSGFRKAESGMIYEEGGMLGHLMRRLPQHRDTCPSTFDWLCLLRHYGLPVRLLDWTENLLISLWIAAQKDENGMIFALNARELFRETDFPYFDRVELPVYGPGNFNVVIRSEMAFTSHLDELFLKSSVREAAQSIGFSDSFWWFLTRIVSCLTEEDIQILEKDETVALSAVLENFLNNSLLTDELYQKTYQEMPIWLQQSLSGQNEKESIKNFLFKFLIDLRKPVAVFPDRRNIRLVAQSGMFVLSGGDYLPNKLYRPKCLCRTPKPIHLEDWRNKPNKVLSQAVIPASYKNNIRQELEMIGIHQASVYPDLETQAEYIKNLWEVPLWQPRQSG